jgi:predicted nucleic acid-binding protein
VLVYADSSALVKRALHEAESVPLVDTLAGYVESGARLFSSSLSAIETTRIIRQRLDDMDTFTVVDLIGAALSGFIEYPITDQVASIASRLGPFSLRSLDAIHLATATLVNADLVCAYDQRLLLAASELGFRTISPGTVSSSH